MCTDGWMDGGYPSLSLLLFGTVSYSAVMVLFVCFALVACKVGCLRNVLTSLHLHLTPLKKAFS